MVPQGREPAAGRFCLRPREGRPARSPERVPHVCGRSIRTGRDHGCRAGDRGWAYPDSGRAIGGARPLLRPDITATQRKRSLLRSEAVVQPRAAGAIAADEIREPGPTPSLLAQSARNRTSAFTARVRSRVRVGHSAPACSSLFEPSRKPEPPQPSRPRGRSLMETGSSSTSGTHWVPGWRRADDVV